MRHPTAIPSYLRDIPLDPADPAVRSMGICDEPYRPRQAGRTTDRTGVPFRPGSTSGRAASAAGEDLLGALDFKRLRYVMVRL